MGELPARVRIDLCPEKSLKSFKGSDLAGTVARHPMHHLGGFFARPRPFLPADHVTTDAGTGLVHMSPDHGEEDFLVCKAAGIDPVFAVDDGGFYRADGNGWAASAASSTTNSTRPTGRSARACARPALCSPPAPISTTPTRTRWRSKAKVIYRCTPQWFIPMDKKKPSPMGVDRTAVLITVRARRSPHPHPDPLPEGEGITLRATALAAIEETRWVPGEIEEPDPRHGRGAARLGDQPPARLGRADRALRQSQDRRLSEGRRGQLAASSAPSTKAAPTPGSPPITRPCSATATGSKITSRRRTSSTSGSTAARPTPM